MPSNKIMPRPTPVVITAPNDAAQQLQAIVSKPCNQHEDVFARHFVTLGNATQAYVDAHPGCEEHNKRHVLTYLAWKMANRPHVLARIREYRSVAAAATTLDVSAMIESDRQIVQGYEHRDELMRLVRQSCRYCHGVDHKYQWLDFAEYLETLAKVEEQNELRRAQNKKDLPAPSDEGGYDFDPHREPSITCPKCEGHGIEKTVFADTTRLSGPAAAILKGIKVGQNGQIEYLLHDIDKAKDRLYRIAGAYGDDAASVAGAAARGAAAGSAASAAIAASVAERVKDMSADDARKAYLDLISRG